MNKRNFTQMRAEGKLEEVPELFRALDILNRTQFVKGVFQETLPVSQLGQIAVLHLDGDWYESVK